MDNVFLSRPWRPYGKTVYIRCELGGHINPAGWDNWGKKSNEKTAWYAEYQSTGAGAAPASRAGFSHQLKNLKKYDIVYDESITSWDEGLPLGNGSWIK